MPIRPLCLCWCGSHFFFLMWQLLFILQDPAPVLTPPGSLPWLLSACVVYSLLPLCFYSILYLWAQKKNTSMAICIWFLFGLPGFRSRLNFTILFCLMLLPDHCLKQCPAGFVLYSDISTIYYFIYKYKYIYKICIIYIYFFSVYQREQKSQEHDISDKG